MKKISKRGKFAKWIRYGLLIITVLLAMIVGLILYPSIAAGWVSRGKLYTDIRALPEAKVGLVFGTTDRVNGRENLYFKYRIDAAEKVWKAQKLETIIVSGDNRSEFYNEPEKMKAALIARGIPGDRIVCDYAGLRTLDSVVRAKEIFGADPIMFISQKFQNERAIYIAQAHGIRAYGYNAKDVQTQAGLKTKVREIGARVKMWLDIRLLKTRPRHLGDKIDLPQ